jgi:hypothetical protein
LAAALHSTSGGQPAARRQPAEEEDKWDMDAVWHELKAKSGGGKKRNKLGREIIASSAFRDLMMSSGSPDLGAVWATCKGT